MTANGRTAKRAARRARWRSAAVGGAVTLAIAVVLAGCASGGSGGSGAASGPSCGNMRTAVNVPVVIHVAKGTVACAAALRVEQGYAAMIKDGDVRGNGGGAPVTVDGWTCQGYSTTQALQTGDTSECHKANAEVVAVLAVPSSGS